MMRCSVVCQAIAIVLTVAVSGSSQGESKDTRLLKLRLQEAQLTLDQSSADVSKAEAAYKEAQTLFGKGLYTKKDLADAEDAFRSAKLRQQEASINLEKTRLDFLNNALYVTLTKAALYLDQNGQKHALLSIRNNSNIAKIIDEEGKYSTNEKQGLLSIDNLTVRILKDDNLIGRPFEYKIPRLSFGQSKDVDFVLQRETEALTVQIAYGDTLVRLPVILEKEAKDDHVLVQSSLFSQEGELGTRVDYKLELERFVDDNKTFTLQVANMPPTYAAEYYEVDETTKTEQRVSTISFKKGITTKTLRFSVNMPREIKKEELGQKIGFLVLVIDRFAQQRLADAMAARKGLPLRSQDLDSARVSYVPLELIPRGRAEVTIVSPNLFIKQKLGDPITFQFDLQNTGTVALDMLRIYLTLPVNWSASVVPEKEISLDVEARKRVNVELVPAIDAVAGDYEVKIEAKTLHEGRDVEAAAKTLRLQLEGKSNFLLGAILIIALIGMFVGVAVMTIRISRR